MEIQNFINGPISNETISNLRNKAKSKTKQAFSELFNESKGQASNVTANLPENLSADNGVKSTLLSGNLDLQITSTATAVNQENLSIDNNVKSSLILGRLQTQQTQTTGAMSTINLTDEELQGWHNGKLPEGWRQTNAGGVIFSGGTKAYNDYFNVYYTDGAEHDYQFGVFYDENSPEDNPVVYLRKIEASTYRELDSTETIRVEVNKVNPSNATYEEMIALAGYIYRDDPKAAFEACEAVDMAREAMQADGLDWQNGPHDYTSYYLPEVVRRYKEYDPELSGAADMLLNYLKDYPRGSDKA
ncbi:MAG: hypothetical protein IJU48_10290 [Synergistaceae bacterium]|nr:hypothetical protein [Synergistaceae bacterium]